MTRTEQLMQERDDLKAKIASAANAETASERDAADLKMMQQELLALEQRIAREETASSKASHAGSASLTEKMDRKLDAALEETFPGSDPVSFLEAKPVKKGDESLTEVKAGKR
ncbi:MAG: hypothetical protein ACK4JB_22155 [Reyranella sp.]